MSTPRERVRARAFLGAASGLLASAVIYLAAPPEAENPLGDPLTDSKAYLRQLELYGGTADVLSVELEQGFLGLWHGRRLAFTVLTLSLAGAAAYGWVGSRVAALAAAAARDRGPGPRPPA